VSALQTTILGAIAGGTIFLGLPVGRLGSLGASTRALLAAFSAGVLLFLFADVMKAAQGIVDVALDGAKDDGGSWLRVAAYSALMLGGFAVAMLSLTRVEAVLHRRRPLPPVAGGSAEAVALPTFDADGLALQARRAALSLGMMIAVAIGLHNFAEGLAIGVASRSGEVSLAATLIVGFALHNATEGFGIVGPLGDARPSWRWLGLAGLIGGGPTLVGTMIGYRITAEPVQLAFLALAAGAIAYVVGELWSSTTRRAPKQLVLCGITLGFTVGLASDILLEIFGG
jgi:ZIP family zinc transporter